MAEEKKQELSCEEVIERLKAEFKTVKFLAGSVGFMVRKGEHALTFPYIIFNDPNFPHIIVGAVTILELGGGAVIPIDPRFEL